MDHKNYVVRKDDATVYRSAGYCDFTGQFDPDVYEQKPEPDLDLAQMTREPVKDIARELTQDLNTLNDDQQADLTIALAVAAVKLNLDAGKFTVAQKIIENTAVPPELEALKTQMLGRFAS